MNMHRATVTKSINFGLMQSIFENKVRPKIKNLLNDSKQRLEKIRELEMEATPILPQLQRTSDKSLTKLEASPLKKVKKERVQVIHSIVLSEKLYAQGSSVKKPSALERKDEKKL
jgi:hypothetical protein